MIPVVTAKCYAHNSRTFFHIRITVSKCDCTHYIRLRIDKHILRYEIKIPKRLFCLTQFYYYKLCFWCNSCKIIHRTFISTHYSSHCRSMPIVISRHTVVWIFGSKCRIYLIPRIYSVIALIPQYSYFCSAIRCLKYILRIIYPCIYQNYKHTASVQTGNKLPLEIKHTTLI